MTTKKKTNKKEVKQEPTKRVIKKKNYFILAGVFAITILVFILLRTWYISYRDYRLTIPVLKGTLSEVTVAELDHYITANPDAIIYIEVSEDANSRDVANGLKEVVKKRNLTNKVVYLNISSEEDKELFFEKFSEKYIDGKDLTHYPALVLFMDGKVDSFVSRTDRQTLNIGNIEQLFDEYELEGE